MRRFAAVSLLALVPTTSCVVVGPSCPTGAAAVVVTPSTVVVAVGSSVTPSATWCHRGNHEQVYPRWSVSRSEESAVIDVDPASGRITGKRAGQATVVVSYGPASGDSRVPVTVR